MKRFFLISIFILPYMAAYAQAKPKEFTHYIFPDFFKGVILLKSGIKNEVKLNYNSLTEEMVFIDKAGLKQAIPKEVIDNVDTVFVNGRKFCPVNHKLYELLYHANSDLFAEHKCRLIAQGKPSGYGGTSQTADVATFSSLRSSDKVYELNLPEDYDVKPYTYYWLKKDGQLNRFTTMNQLMKLYESKKDIYKDYIKKHDVNFNNGGSIALLVDYLETH